MAGGTVSLTEGLFTIAAAIDMAQGTRLIGQAPFQYPSSGLIANEWGTIITLAASYADTEALSTQAADNMDIHYICFDGDNQAGIEGIQADDSDELDIKGCCFSQFAGSGIAFGATASSLAVTLDRCVFLNNGNGLYVSPFALTDSDITRNYFSSNTTYGAFLSAGSNFNPIIGNKFDWNGSIGLVLFGQKCSVTANLFDRNVGDGLYMAYGAARNPVVGNTFHGNGSGGSTSGSRHIYLDSNPGNDVVQIIINSNTFELYATTSKPEYCIVDRDASIYTVQGNDFTGGFNTGVFATISGSPVRTVRNNPGYVTEASGTCTLVNGQTSIAVTHGLAVTPAIGDVMATPIEAWGSALQFWISAYSSTTFTITVDQDPGQDVDFAWKAVVL